MQYIVSYDYLNSPALEGVTIAGKRCRMDTID
jgi:hypothetical protein